jgi:ABC-type transport system substrate-binding protein
VDYTTHGFPPATDREFQRKGLTVLRPPTYYGLGILPNHARIPALRNKVVRQALLYAVDRKQSGAVAEGKSGRANKYIAGFSDSLAPEWLDSATICRLNPYPHDPVKAASLLKSIGWKKGSDGVWRTPDGTKAEWEVQGGDTTGGMHNHIPKNGKPRRACAPCHGKTRPARRDGRPMPRGRSLLTMTQPSGSAHRPGGIEEAIVSMLR